MAQPMAGPSACQGKLGEQTLWGTNALHISGRFSRLAKQRRLSLSSSWARAPLLGIHLRATSSNDHLFRTIPSWHAGSVNGEQITPRRYTMRTSLIGAALLAAAIFIGGYAIGQVGGVTNILAANSTVTSTPATSAPSFPAHGSAAHENAEEAVTGSAASQAHAAAVKYEGGGTAGPVTSNFQGNGYEVTVTKSDGRSIEVHLDSSVLRRQTPAPEATPSTRRPDVTSTRGCREAVPGILVTFSLVFPSGFVACVRLKADLSHLLRPTSCGHRGRTSSSPPRPMSMYSASSRRAMPIFGTRRTVYRSKRLPSPWRLKRVARPTPKQSSNLPGRSAIQAGARASEAPTAFRTPSQQRDDAPRSATGRD
jgi:hypothetical protein